MFFFGHIGITVGVVQAINQATKRKVDLRKAALLSILPDLLDKPVALLYPESLGNHTRLWAHSLVFTLLCYLILKAWPGSKKRYPGILAGVYLGHMVLDRIWLNSLYAFFWPFVSFPAPLDPDIFMRWSVALTQPWTLGGELAGLSILIFMYFHYRLSDRRRMFELLRTGNLSAVPQKKRYEAHLHLP